MSNSSMFLVLLVSIILIVFVVYFYLVLIHMMESITKYFNLKSKILEQDLIVSVDNDFKG